MDIWMSLLNERDERDCHPPLRRQLFLSTKFSTKILGRRYNYESVKRWRSNMGIPLIFERGMVHIPVNVNGSHWGIVHYCPGTGELSWYDSMGYDFKKFSPFLERIKQYLCDERKDVANQQNQVRVPSGSFVLGKSSGGVVGRSPLQTNSDDCGVFALIYFDSVASGTIPEFTAADIIDLRYKIAMWPTKPVISLGVPFPGPEECGP